MRAGAMVLVVMALVGCRTQLLEATAPGDLATAARDAAVDAANGNTVSCGPKQTCAIAAGEHCCEESPLTCRTAPCKIADQFDCDGPEDCSGGVCCFPIRNAPSRAACAPSCSDGTVLCHSTADCPPSTFCCLNFVLGPSNGLCLSACD